MAQKVTVLLVDDIDGGSADETVSFSLDGVSYEIDLSSKNASAFRDALAQYVGTARRVGSRVGSRGSAGRTPARRRSSWLGGLLGSRRRCVADRPLTFSPV